MIRIKSKKRMKGREGGCWDDRCLEWVSALVSIQCHRGESELKHTCVVFVSTAVFVSTVPHWDLRVMKRFILIHSTQALWTHRWHCICSYLYIISVHFKAFFPFKSPTPSHPAALSLFLSLIASISVLIICVNHLVLLLVEISTFLSCFQHWLWEKISTILQKKI